MVDVNKFACMAKKGDFASPNASSQYRPNLELEPTHMSINLVFDIKNKKANGSVVTTIRSNSNGILNINLDATKLNIFDIKSYSSQGNNKLTTNWTYDGRKINISWDKTWEKNEERNLDITYEVVRPIAGLYFSYPNDYDENAPIFVGADHETERARYWLPCIDHPSVRCTLDFTLTSEMHHTILANGKLINEVINEKEKIKTSKWNLDFPCPSYLTTICIGELESFIDREANAGNGPIPVAYYTTKKHQSADLGRSFDKTPEMLEWMVKKLGVPLPYPKYFQYALPTHGGAMENISLVSWNDNFVLDEVLNKEFSWLVDQINIHEMAHSWFGDAVVMKDFAHAWLKESWATYMETVWLEDKVSKEEGDYDRFVNERRYINETKRYVRTIVTNRYDSSWDLFDGHLYPGGAQRIDMLRKLLGDNIFWSSITEYLTIFEKKLVETIDFQRILEKNSSLNLQKFFDQWFYLGKGFPKLKISYKYDDEHSAIELKVKQTQVNKDQGIGLFDFLLEVQVETTENNFDTYSFSIMNEEHTFYIKQDSTPLQVCIDSNHKILSEVEYNPGESMLKRIIESGSIKNKILAFNELAKDGNKETVDYLVTKYKETSFWGMKTEIINSISSIFSFDSIKALHSLLEFETDPMVLPNLLDTIKKLKNNEIYIDLYKSLLYKKEIYFYRTQTGLLKLIGSLRTNNEENMDFINNYKPTTDNKDIISRGKLEAIGNLRTEKASLFLLDQIKSLKYDERRQQALLTALIESIIWANDGLLNRVKEEFVNQLLRTENIDSLKTLVNLSMKLKDPSIINQLIAVKSKMEKQSHPFVDRTINQINSIAKTRNEIDKSIEERLSKLEKNNLELKEKISKLETLNK